MSMSGKIAISIYNKKFVFATNITSWKVSECDKKNHFSELDDTKALTVELFNYLIAKVFACYWLF